MLEKDNIEAFLRVNGIAPTAKDEEIRSVLLSARWNHDEVDTALMVLKENIKDQTTHVDTLHKVFNSDKRLSAAEISSLLGITVNIANNEVNTPIAKFTERNENLNFFAALLLSVTISLSSIGYLMYREKAGFFAVKHALDTQKSAPTIIQK
jgi:hypothetical protein